jgi:16S rRNA (cytosine967-C5)-methyltransferase
LEEIERLTVVQAEILESHAKLVRPGGKLVYATCSILPAENERQVEKFLAAHAGEWVMEEELHIRPGQSPGSDGFYAARLGREMSEVKAPEASGMSTTAESAEAEG